MFESEHKLKHLAFFEEIASHAEGEPDWHAAVAGLVVLRLVDSWLDEGPALMADDAFVVRSVESAIEEVSPGTPIRTLLGRVLDALRERKPDIHVVVTPLMAYAQALEYDAKWTLAADVYNSVLAHLHPLEDTDASIAAHLRLGSCYRSLQQLDNALATYASASEIATASGDMVGILRARVGEAHVFVLRGDLPSAQTILDETIERASGDGLRDVRSRALHQRAEVAKMRGQYDLAVRFAYDALSYSETPSERDRILSDIAGAFLDLGIVSAARDAYLVLSATAMEQFIRWNATINLIELSAVTGAELLFEQYKRQLANTKLPPYLATGYHLTVGTGYQRLDRNEEARAHLERALALATEHGFNQALFDAEEALLGVELVKPRRPQPAELSLDLQEVAGAIQRMRESAGVG